MKLYELSTDRALDALCEIAPAAANIMGDTEIISALELVTAKNEEESQSNFAYGLKIVGEIGKMAPVLLKSHRSDVYTILSVTNEKPIAEISSQPIRETVLQLREVLQDGDLMSFFKSSVRRARSELSAPSVESPACE